MSKASLGEYIGMEFVLSRPFEQYDQTEIAEMVLGKVIDGSTFEIGTEEIIAEVDNKIDAFCVQIHNSGITFEQYLKDSGKTEEELRAQLYTIAEATMRKALVMQQIANEQNITVDNEQLRARVRSMAEGMGADFLEFTTFLQQSGQFMAVHQELLWDNITDFMVKKSNFIVK